MRNDREILLTFERHCHCLLISMRCVSFHINKYFTRVNWIKPMPMLESAKYFYVLCQREMKSISKRCSWHCNIWKCQSEWKRPRIAKKPLVCDWSLIVQAGADKKRWNRWRDEAKSIEKSSHVKVFNCLLLSIIQDVFFYFNRFD